MNALPSVMLVDDDTEFCSMVVEYLNQDGFDVAAVHSDWDALDRLSRRHVDVMVLDVMMPGMSGQELLRQLRAATSPIASIPVVMLTARGDEIDRVVGLEIGADEYVAKPCSLRELAARLRAILRRAATVASPPGHQDVVNVGDLELNRALRSVRRGGSMLKLTGAEFAVLQCLMESAGFAVGKEKLVRVALGREYYPDDRSIDVHIAHLRKKIDDGEDGESRIRTIRGAGYILVGEKGS